MQATIQLAHTMGMRVVAEGVEDDASLSLLRELKCDLAQGYLISRPKPAAQLLLEPMPMAGAGSGEPASGRASASHPSSAPRSAPGADGLAPATA